MLDADRVDLDDVDPIGRRRLRVLRIDVKMSVEILVIDEAQRQVRGPKCGAVSPCRGAKSALRGQGRIEVHAQRPAQQSGDAGAPPIRRPFADRPALPAPVLQPVVMRCVQIMAERRLKVRVRVQVCDGIERRRGRPDGRPGGRQIPQMLADGRPQAFGLLAPAQRFPVLVGRLECAIRDGAPDVGVQREIEILVKGVRHAGSCDWEPGGFEGASTGPAPAGGRACASCAEARRIVPEPARAGSGSGASSLRPESQTLAASTGLFTSRVATGIGVRRGWAGRPHSSPAPQVAP